MGYFSGPTLNQSTYKTADPQFIAAGRWTHPTSNRRYTYYFLVVSESRHMNAGINPSYVADPSTKKMVANVELHQATMKIEGRYRPVYKLKTITAVEKDEELLLDYGVASFRLATGMAK